MLTVETIEKVAADLQGRDIGEETVQALRSAYPEVHFTWCMDDDIYNGKPVKEEAGFNLYLVNSSETCLSLTANLESATGLVIAEVIDDGDENA